MTDFMLRKRVSFSEVDQIEIIDEWALVYCPPKGKPFTLSVI
jgi:hypothetical protein